MARFRSEAHAPSMNCIELWYVAPCASSMSLGHNSMSSSLSIGFSEFLIEERVDVIVKATVCLGRAHLGIYVNGALARISANRVLR